MASTSPLPLAASRRESACPVHFVWDGEGPGRPVVRAGFLLLLAASLIAVGAIVWPASGLRPVAGPAFLGALAVWACGQALSRFARR